MLVEVERVQKGQMMEKPARSLRTILAATTWAVAMLGLMGSVSLIVLTSMLERTSERAMEAAERVRLVEEAQVDLLQHERAKNPALRADLERRLRRHVAGALDSVDSAQEREVHARLERLLAAKLVASASSSTGGQGMTLEHEAVYAALEELAAIKTEAARLAHEEASTSNVLGNLIGVAVGLTILLLAWAVVRWQKGQVFTPILQLARSMRGYGRGDRHARAEELGPRELRDMSRQFNEMTRDLGAQQDLQRAFLGSVAHDLRSPLAALDLSIARVILDGEHLTREDIRRSAARAKRQVERLDGMISDLLDLAKPDSGHLELDAHAQDLRAVLSSALDLLAHVPRSETLEVKMPEHRVEVYCDARRIEQVLVNLMSNAMKYSSAGEPVTVALEQAGANAIVRVIDRGIGISDKDRRLLFEPFRRVGPHRNQVPGTGLGLFIVKRIVDAHGGSIDVQSHPGEGSTFTVRLPASVLSSKASTDDVRTAT